MWYENYTWWKLHMSMMWSLMQEYYLGVISRKYSSQVYELPKTGLKIGWHKINWKKV